MRLQEVLQAAGRSKRRRRSGRGRGSGRGKTCGRGHKGAGQRAGRKHRYGYEGGHRTLRRMGCLFTSALNGAKARIRLMAVLGASDEPEQIKRLWEADVAGLEGE